MSGCGSPAGGCVCPPDYVGDDPNIGQGLWPEPSFTKVARAPRVGERVFAEGTGDLLLELL